ncbi:DUF4209 domain-containing protein [Massilia sp.]|uniref:DUF4209 domain-containing protein n=1 Tax=Massilia sp. TaxID=1882437 RepID=UPI00352F1F6C
MLQRTAAAPTLADFYHSGAANIIAAHPDATLRALVGPLFEAAAVARAAGETASEAILALLGGICSMVLQPANRPSPLTHMASWSDGTTSFDPDHLRPHDLDLLAQLAGHVDHVPLRARLADLVWLRARRHGHAYALRAIDDYTSTPPDPATWYDFGYAHWHRALQLARELKGTAAERMARIEDTLVDVAEKARETPGHDAMHLLLPLTEEKLGRQHQARVCALLEHRARDAAATRDAHEASGYLQTAKIWFERSGQPDRAAEMQALLARTWEEHADIAPDAAVSHAFYQDAISAYRAVPAKYRSELGIDAALQAVRLKYEKAGSDAVGEMVMICEREEDLTDFMEAAVERVRKPDPLSALFAFCSLQRLPSTATYLRGAEAFVNESILMWMMGGATLAQDGRVVSRVAGAAAGAAAPAEQVEERAMLDFVNHAGKIGAAMIEPALDQLHLDHVITVNDFRAIAQRSNIVAQDRIAVVGTALYAGYQGDLEHALHVLMPQFEHIVREILKVAGALTVHHDPREGLDMEIGLSSLTERPEMITVFGEDWTFAIRSMMCVEPGPNLRNLIAHGLAESHLCQGPYGRYTWWLVLRFIVEQFYVRWANDGGASPDRHGEVTR